ncbi:RNA polymerase sigma-70 factor, ECF subfamily [Evansella caseinilytica]|uniref:RNA polymerase sigma-70 factor, ECF subfamily n=1 Tax=Evansella caseinilytica TaxID=1503961 RepID=A0A1H3Q995_9BACI|nr:RNA polymerase sigma factor [Evansella caseinilytica]SDZ09249.1 RNA polymerase sigma-70 factor, ECF subfamily [Evansella caseinilytica]
MKQAIDFDELYSQFYRRLFHIGYSITRDRHLAEDVVHETFLKAYLKAETIEDEGKIGSWLSSIAARTAIDVFRREKKKKGILMEQEMLDYLGEKMSFHVEQEVETWFLEEQMKTAIRKLKLDYQNVLMLKLGYDLKEDEIAHVLHLKPSTVKTRIYRARKQLKLLFEKQMSA